MINEKYKNELSNIKSVSNMREQFKEFCTSERTRLSTGYLNLDFLLGGGLTDELYVFGAPTSSGKTAFLMSIAQNLAKAGVYILYFSLEMSCKEHIARGTALISYETKIKGESMIAYTTQDILSWRYNHDTEAFEKLQYSCYEPYVDEYFKRYGDKLHIIESGSNGLDAKRIANIASEFRSIHLEEPFVVIVDYLQIVADSNNSDRKTSTDNMMSTFKNLSLNMEVPVICISSIGREGYGKRIALDSFKESGNIEFGAGVCLGWSTVGENIKPYKEDEALLSQYKREGCRLIELDVLKSRNGEKGISARFKYNPAYNYFEELRD